MRYHVFLYSFTNVLEEPATSIFRPENAGNVNEEIQFSKSSTAYDNQLVAF
jgi:hypothetical protein